MNLALCIMIVCDGRWCGSRESGGARRWDGKQSLKQGSRLSCQIPTAAFAFPSCYKPSYTPTNSSRPASKTQRSSLPAQRRLPRQHLRIKLDENNCPSRMRQRRYRMRRHSCRLLTTPSAPHLVPSTMNSRIPLRPSPPRRSRRQALHSSAHSYPSAPLLRA